MIHLTTVEVKYKSLTKPMYLKALTNFNKQENVTYSYVINKDYANFETDTKYISPALIEKIFTQTQIK